MTEIKSHKDLRVWQESINLVEQIYSVTQNFPNEEKYGLVSQMRRCAVSVPSNIAEGSARKGNKEYMKFLYISLGSLTELETQIIISYRLNFLEELPDLNEKILYIKRMLLKLIGSVKEGN